MINLCGNNWQFCLKSLLLIYVTFGLVTKIYVYGNFYDNMALIITEKNLNAGKYIQ